MPKVLFVLEVWWFLLCKQTAIKQTCCFNFGNWFLDKMPKYFLHVVLLCKNLIFEDSFRIFSTPRIIALVWCFWCRFWVIVYWRILVLVLCCRPQRIFIINYNCSLKFWKPFFFNDATPRQYLKSGQDLLCQKKKTKGAKTIAKNMVIW